MVLRHLNHNLWITDPKFVITLYRNETPFKKLGFFHLDHFQVSGGVSYELKKQMEKDFTEDPNEYWAEVAGYVFYYNEEKEYYEAYG